MMPSRNRISPGITMPVTKHNYLVKNTDEIEPGCPRSVLYRGTGRPGPVLIDLPKDVSTGLSNDVRSRESPLRGYNPTYKGHTRQIDKVLEPDRRCRTPAIYAGGGVISSNASAELIAFADPDRDPGYDDPDGSRGHPLRSPAQSRDARHARHRVCELRGDRMRSPHRYRRPVDDRVTGKIDTFAPHAKIVHIDINPAEIGKNKRVDVPIVGDVKAVLTDMLTSIKKGTHDAWRKKIQHWNEHHPLKYPDEREAPPAVHPPADERPC